MVSEGCERRYNPLCDESSSHLYSTRFKLDTFQIKVDTILSKHSAFEIKLNVLQIKTSLFQIELETLQHD